jgi:hypothetical protein
MGRGTGRPRNPVSIQIGSQILTHRIPSEPASNQTKRSDDKVEHHTQDNSRIDPTEEVPDRHPAPVRPIQAFWKYHSRDEQTRRQDYGPPSGILGAPDVRPNTYESKNAPDGETERPQLPFVFIVLHGQLQ